MEISKTSEKRQDFSNPAAVKLPIVKTVDSIQIVKFTSVNLKTIELTNFVNNMFDTTTDSCGSQQQLFTTRYSYGGRDQEYVFCCRGRPFAALVSQNLPTPTSSLIDFDLVKTLGLKVTDLQCKKFFFAGNKMRILGRVSTTVQCIQNGRTGSNFHIKGFVVSDLYKLLDSHCVAGNKMRQHIKTLLDAGGVSEDDDDDEDVNNVFINERKCEKAQKSDEKSEVSSLPQQASAPQTGRRIPSSSSSPRSGNPSSTTRATLTSSCSSGPTMPSSTFTPTTPASAIPFDPQAMRTPIPPGICPKPSSLYAIVQHGESFDEALDYWENMKLWEKYAEKIPFDRTLEDDKPRVVNLAGGSHDAHCDMLRIGNWDKLDDPSSHQARHVLLANIRRTDPDRFCESCSYEIQHSCPLSTVQKHCVLCCDTLKLWVKASERRKKK